MLQHMSGDNQRYEKINENYINIVDWYMGRDDLQTSTGRHP